MLPARRPARSERRPRRRRSPPHGEIRHRSSVSRSSPGIRRIRWAAPRVVGQDPLRRPETKRCTHQLLTAAAATPLRGLFPCTSHNTLHFSRCSYYPFTHDCPWIWFDSGPRFVTYERIPGASRATWRTHRRRSCWRPTSRRHTRRGACASAAGAGHLGR
ncbi:DUF6193 family natural product biosynthesis protein [Polymorphospora rubra]|uniref:DUF6193 family natural product biosynthesis protein n=1 Tax=Polymorphospora rubra TaxID=338584 RepID=UPI003CCE7B85